MSTAPMNQGWALDWTRSKL